jgi:hypothetical protein
MFESCWGLRQSCGQFRQTLRDGPKFHALDFTILFNTHRLIMKYQLKGHRWPYKWKHKMVDILGSKLRIPTSLHHKPEFRNLDPSHCSFGVWIDFVGIGSSPKSLWCGEWWLQQISSGISTSIHIFSEEDNIKMDRLEIVYEGSCSSR